MNKILIIEDEIDIRDLIALHCQRSGYEVIEKEDAELGIQYLEKNSTDLIILDWMLPAMSGVQFLEKIRRQNITTPVLMLTAKVAPEDIVEGLDQGADDYLTKPFDAAILLARVKALLRRSNPQANLNLENTIILGSIKIIPDSHEVYCQGEKIQLTLSEYKLLITLCENRGKVMTRQKLISSVQGEDIAVIARAIDTHIFGLRKKLKSCGENIETIRGVGYRAIE